MLEIDHPHADEAVALSHYTFRMSGPETIAFMEISVDRGPWQSCRRACGYWWFDWTNYGAGPHQLVARGQNRDGSSIGSMPRRFTAAARKP